MRVWLSVMVTFALIGVWLAPGSRADVDRVAVVQPVILAEIPHDPAAFTEGLELDGGALYEATGLVGQSQLRELDPNTGEVRRKAALPPAYFGEGITVVGDRIWQLTYDSGVAIEWDKRTFQRLREVPVSGQAWGLCLDGNRLIMSDGTDRLRFLETENLTEIGSVSVTRDGGPVSKLDELECVDGQVWAGVWPTDQFVRIDPATGLTNLVLDTSNAWRGGNRTNRQVMSSIAHIAGNEYFIEGKEWPWMLRVRIDEPS
jgi:glutamine cyclotransferase